MASSMIIALIMLVGVEAMPVDDNYDKATQLQEENAQLQAKNAQLQAENAALKIEAMVVPADKNAEPARKTSFATLPSEKEKTDLNLDLGVESVSVGANQKYITVKDDRGWVAPQGDFNADFTDTSYPAGCYAIKRTWQFYFIDGGATGYGVLDGDWAKVRFICEYTGSTCQSGSTSDPNSEEPCENMPQPYGGQDPSTILNRGRCLTCLSLYMVGRSCQYPYPDYCDLYLTCKDNIIVYNGVGSGRRLEAHNENIDMHGSPQTA